MLTDGLRALLLDACGYDTQVFEFVSLEHTAKNKMILAVKRAQPAAQGRAAGAGARDQGLLRHPRTMPGVAAEGRRADLSAASRRWPRRLRRRVEVELDRLSERVLQKDLMQRGAVQRLLAELRRSRVAAAPSRRDQAVGVERNVIDGAAVRRRLRQQGIQVDDGLGRPRTASARDGARRGDSLPAARSWSCRSRADRGRSSGAQPIVTWCSAETSALMARSRCAGPLRHRMASSTSASTAAGSLAAARDRHATCPSGRTSTAPSASRP